MSSIAADDITPSPLFASAFRRPRFVFRCFLLSFLAPLLAARAQEGDYIVCLGAGNITQWAAALPAELGKLIGQEPEAA